MKDIHKTEHPRLIELAQTHESTGLIHLNPEIMMRSQIWNAEH